MLIAGHADCWAYWACCKATTWCRIQPPPPPHHSLWGNSVAVRPLLTCQLLLPKIFVIQTETFCCGAGNRKWGAVGARDAGEEEAQLPRTGLTQPEASLTTITTEDSPQAWPIDRVLGWEDLGTATPALPTDKVSLDRPATAAAAPRVLTRTPPSWPPQLPLQLGQG